MPRDATRRTRGPSSIRRPRWRFCSAGSIAGRRGGSETVSTPHCLSERVWVGDWRIKTSVETGWPRAPSDRANLGRAFPAQRCRRPDSGRATVVPVSCWCLPIREGRLLPHLQRLRAARGQTAVHGRDAHATRPESAREDSAAPVSANREARAGTPIPQRSCRGIPALHFVRAACFLSSCRRTKERAWE